MERKSLREINARPWRLTVPTRGSEVGRGTDQWSPKQMKKLAFGDQAVK